MAQYVVKSGDTLSAIGAKYGVDYSKITGYKSGNPNLIYAGEVLNIPDGGSTITPTSTPSQTQNQQTVQQNNSPTGSTPPPYAPNVQDQTVVYNGVTWKGQPGGGWVAQSTASGGSLANTSSIVPQKPTIDLNALYEANYNTPEIKTALSDIDKAQAELDVAQKARDDAVANEADNPFYAEGTLTGKKSKIDDKFNADAVRIQNKIAIAQNKLATLKSDAQIKTNIALQQYNIESDEYKTTLSQLNNLMASGGLTNASASDIAQFATAVGVPVSMIQSVVNKQKAEQVKPHVITATDDSGNMTAVIIDTNTGKTISSTSLGKIDKSKTANGDKTTASDQKTSAELDVQKYLKDKNLQAQISPEDLYLVLLRSYPDAIEYIKSNWTPTQIRVANGEKKPYGKTPE